MADGHLEQVLRLHRHALVDIIHHAADVDDPFADDMPYGHIPHPPCAALLLKKGSGRGMGERRPAMLPTARAAGQLDGQAKGRRCGAETVTVPPMLDVRCVEM